MAFRKRSNFKKKVGGRYKRRTVRRTKRSKSTYGTFAKRVKNVMSRIAEKKCVDYFYAQKELYLTTQASFANQVQILTPDTGSNATTTIAQGSLQGQRSGNTVSTKSFILKGSINVNPSWSATQNDNPQPIYATMWIVKLKPYLDDNVAMLENVIDNSFFQNGSTSIGFTDRIVDMQKTVNTQQITLLAKRTFKIGMAQYMSGTGVNTGNNTNQQYANNDAAMVRMFTINLTKKMPRSYSFNDGTNIANCRRVYMFWSACRCDGGAFTASLNATPAFFNTGVEYRYTDY